MFFDFIFRARNKTLKDICGQYINASAVNSSRAFDTIVIIKQDHKKNLFQVERKFLCGRMKKRKMILKEFSFEKWEARYSEKRSVLTAVDKSSKIEMDPNCKKIMFRKISYIKLSR